MRGAGKTLEVKKKKLYEPVSTSPTPELKSYTQLRKEISHGVPGKSFGRLTSNALVLCQEITLSTYFLARHRISIYHESTPDVDQRVQYSTLALFGAQVVAMFYSIQSRQDTLQPSRRIKAAQRIQDGALLAILLRFVASVIRALTASYSTDTVELLTAISMIVHLLTCDYTYANGFSNPMDLGYSKTFNTAMKRPPFLGGTLSLNAAFFATVLAVSRIQDNTHAYFFVSLAIILFAFYPFTRHAISESFPPHQSPAHWLITFFTGLAAHFLLDTTELQSQYLVTLVVFGLLIPLWKYFLQRCKRVTPGTWNIPTAESMRLHQPIE